MSNSETNRIEYKEILNNDFEQEVIAFLNYKEGGIIYVGVRKNGQVVGVEDIDLTQFCISASLFEIKLNAENIKPEYTFFFSLYSFINPFMFPDKYCDKTLSKFSFIICFSSIGFP